MFTTVWCTSKTLSLTLHVLHQLATKHLLTMTGIYRSFMPSHHKTKTTTASWSTSPYGSRQLLQLTCICLPVLEVMGQPLCRQRAPHTVVPAVLCRCTLTHLHDSHGGIETTRCHDRQTIFWPGIDSIVKSTVEVL